MPTRTPLPPTLAGHVFAIDVGREHGLSRGRMRGPDLVAPFSGVRAPAALALGIQELAVVYSTRMPTAAFFSHVTAARLWDIPLPYRLEGRDLPLDVGVPANAVVPRGAGVVGHHLQLDAGDVVTLGPLRLTSPARTWCDLAALLSHEDLVAAGDSLLWRQRPESSRVVPSTLADAVARFRGRRGRPALRGALPRLTDRSDSRAESLVRCRIIAAGLPEPEVNLDLYDSSGTFVARPDLSFRRYRVCLDYEGDHHRTDAVQWEKDIARVTRIENAHWRHLRAGRADLRDTTELIDNLLLRLRARGWSRGSPGQG